MSNLDHVAVFARVVEAGGFSSAARTLNIPKSSASRSVSQLEETLGVRLLQRTTRQLRLTEAGQEYYERVAGALAALDEARAVVTETRDAPTGLVRLAAPAEYGAWVLAPVLAQFLATHGGIRLEVSLTNRDVDLVRDGFDLALRVGRLHDSSLIVRTIGAIDRGLYATPSYLARRGTPGAVSELATHDFIVSRVGGSGPRLRLHGPSGVETVLVSGPVVTDDLTFVQEAVRLSMGIGLLPTAGCATHLGLVRVLPEYSEPGLSYSLVYPSARYLPQRVALLRDVLLEELQARIRNPFKSCEGAARFSCATNGPAAHGAQDAHGAPAVEAESPIVPATPAVRKRARVSKRSS